MRARVAQQPGLTFQHQGKTLHTQDVAGVPLEFCATMPVVPRVLTQFHLHRGGAAHRIDHYQILTPDVRKATEFYMSAGFRLSEYIMPKSEELAGVFLQRKGNPHDIVFFKGAGPRLHHVAFTTPESIGILRACDVAGTLGFGAGVERGPGRHGPGSCALRLFPRPRRPSRRAFQHPLSDAGYRDRTGAMGPGGCVNDDAMGPPGAEEMVHSGDALCRRGAERAGNGRRADVAGTIFGGARRP